MQVKAKKHLGQNFLQDETVIDRIVESADIRSSDYVVEIGPGTGVLTSALSKKANRVIAFEVDTDLMPGLMKKFPLSSNVSLVEQDILRADIMEVIQKNAESAGLSVVQGAIEARSKVYLEGMVSSTGDCNDEIHQTRAFPRYKVVANIPYYITAPIIQYLLELPNTPESIVLMIQKEVAERITAKAGDMSIIAVAAQYYADPELLFMVPKEAFDPIPQVDSAVIRLTPKRVFDKVRDKQFFRLVKFGFSSRRKTLVNNLSAGLHLSKEEVVKKLIQAGFGANTRAQELSVPDWERMLEVF